MIVCAVAAAGPALAASPPAGSNLQLWLDADDGLAADGSAWADKSSYHHDAAGGVGVTATGFAGHAAATFNGSQAMSIGALSLGSSWTIFAVATDGGSSGLRNIISNWDGGNSYTSTFLGTVGGAPGGRLTDNLGGAAYNGNGGVGTLTNPLNPFILAGSRSFDGATTTLSLTQFADPALTANLLGANSYAGGGGGGSNDSTPFYLGRQGSGPFEYWQGDIAEVLVYSGTLSADQRQSVLSYLGQKYLGASAAPEPASWAMMLIGFGATGATLRRHRRVVA